MSFLWWRDGVLYQIYPRSFLDANGDGVGDLRGIEQKLDHLAWLGVDGIWLSPCFPSPMADFGYDVADYCDIDPLFGSLDDFDSLLAAAHARNLRVILDWVPGHTSDQHAWFQESRSSRDSPKRDWYVWRDPAPGGGPPNNWLSLFGGSAWEWDDATGQYYLHGFLVEQPDLNWRNPQLVEAMHGVLCFWLDRGVDGFRIDVIHRILKDPEFRSNPLRPGQDESGGFGAQQHLNDENHPDVHGALRDIRRLLDGYDERMMVGEVYLMDPDEMASYYGQGDELHLAFNFPFLHSPWSAERFGGHAERMEQLLGDVPGGWPTWTLSNHDHSRHISRYDDPTRPGAGAARARLAALLLLTLRGTPFLYYGEEIGMRNVPVPVDQMQDPLAHTLHPNVSRDPERTPMQWDASKGAGFTRAEPWLPIGDAAACNVEAQREDPESLLHLYRELIALRRETPDLQSGAFRRIASPEGVLAFERGNGARVALNFTEVPQTVQLGSSAVTGGISTVLGRALPASSGEVSLAPDEGLLLLGSF
ncbi:MAG: alpha-amylase family glycosyl hydrolase [Myxococcales bacterium]|nr:alpha-amylase family glycosyl hydrolase [Myxococcales bacterium]